MSGSKFVAWNHSFADKVVPSGSGPQYESAKSRMKTARSKLNELEISHFHSVTLDYITYESGWWEICTVFGAIFSEQLLTLFLVASCRANWDYLWCRQRKIILNNNKHYSLFRLYLMHESDWWKNI